MTQIRFDRDETLEQMTNASARLWTWREDIDKLIEKYGQDAILWVDAGSNDAQFVVEVSTEE